MALYYVDDSTENFKAEGFVPFPTDELTYARAKGWERTASMSPSMDLAFHT